MHSQDVLSAYLVAEFQHAVGAYQRSTQELPEYMTGESPIADSLCALTGELERYNEKLASTRFAVGEDRVLRHPRPPAPSSAGTDGPRAHRWYTTRRDCLDYYATVTAALQPGSAACDAAGARNALSCVRGALLIGVEHDVKRVRALHGRFRNREQFLRERLGVDAPVQAGQEQAQRYWNADLQTDSAVGASVLEAAAEAHWLSLLVQHRRSGPVGDEMARVAAGASTLDDQLLERAVALNTFVFAIAESMPWIFARDLGERALAQVRDTTARDRVEPLAALWIARRMILLALYRRAMVWRLLGDHRRSYNDYWKTQHIVGLTKAASIGDSRRMQLNILDALAEYRVSELYRADHDYRQALVHSCRSHDRMRALMENASTARDATRWIENSLWRVTLLLSKGKAFYEQGQMKRACKWFLRAWQALDDVATTSGRRPLFNEAAREELQRAVSWLASVRHEPFISKAALHFELQPTINTIDKSAVPRELHALAADILDRLGHTLMVMRLPDDTLARRCLQLALDLDRWNLLARSDLLQLRSRDKSVTLPRDLPEPLRCWPSGGTVVDQVIRTAEHLTRERLDRASKPASVTDSTSADQLVAHDLLDDFLTHTDSMHVRAGLLYQHLAPSATSVKSQRPKAAMEFVCLRRYGSTSPFMARPAAVPAIGGGYLLRLLSKDSRFNILIDPGDGIVANLYRVGFAITDIDMIIVTHDHPDHMAGLDPILALRKEHVPISRRLQIYGNASVVQRYRAVDLETAAVDPMPRPDGVALRRRRQGRCGADQLVGDDAP
jgi:tetratricopeptide (TPR) repeat protein